MSTPYEPQNAAVICRTNDLRVVEITLAANSQTPPHTHSAVEEICYCLEGQLTFAAKGEPTGVLTAGNRQRFPAGSEHQLCNRSALPCRFLLIHGVGPFDFTPVSR